MFDSLVQQFAGENAKTLEGPQLHHGVAQMMEGANNQHGIGAVSQALEALGGGGFGQSVLAGTSHAGPQQRNSVADMLLGAVSHGGGSPSGVLSQLGIGGQSKSPQDLAGLATYVGNNHRDDLAQVLGTHVGNGGGSEILSLLGNPMVRQIGMNLAQRLMQ
jgi:hypothetical protein